MFNSYVPHLTFVATNDSCSEYLSEQGIKANIAASIVDHYDRCKDKIFSYLEATGISTPAIVGIDWRLDYCVRSKTAGRSNTPLFFVTLTVRDRGLLRRIEMVATPDQLQDMLAKVKDAVKQTDRVLSASSSSS
jgi:COMM domain